MDFDIVDKKRLCENNNNICHVIITKVISICLHFSMRLSTFSHYAKNGLVQFYPSFIKLGLHCSIFQQQIISILSIYNFNLGFFWRMFGCQRCYLLELDLHSASSLKKHTQNKQNLSSK